MKDKYMEARINPKIVHYAGPEKPWTCPWGDFAEIFWDYAKKTPYYEEILYRMSIAAKKQGSEIYMEVLKASVFRMRPNAAKQLQNIKKMLTVKEKHSIVLLYNLEQRLTDF